MSILDYYICLYLGGDCFNGRMVKDDKEVTEGNGFTYYAVYFVLFLKGYNM